MRSSNTEHLYFLSPKVPKFMNLSDFLGFELKNEMSILMSFPVLNFDYENKAT